MRIAICLYGHHPMECLKDIKISHDRTVENWNKHVFSKNQNIDVFLHSWSTSKKNELLQNYNPKDYLIEKQIDFDKTKSTPLYGGYGNDTYEQVHYSHTYSIKKSVELKQKYEKKLGFKYDMVMIARFDLLWFTDVVFDKFNPKKFHVSKWSGKGKRDNSTSKRLGQIAGVWFFSNSDFIDKFGISLFDSAEKYVKRNILKSHLVYKLHLDDIGLTKHIKHVFDDYYDWNGQRFFIYPHYPNGDKTNYNNQTPHTIPNNKKQNQRKKIRRERK